MSTETKTDREMLAEVMHSDYCGPDCIAGPGNSDYKSADAILASDWLRERDGLMRLTGAVEVADVPERAWQDAHLSHCGVFNRFGSCDHDNPYAETSAE